VKSSEKSPKENPKEYEVLKKFAFIRKRLEQAKKKPKKKG
jgi:hypothetical protein